MNRPMKFDSTGLGFSRRGARVFVHYPHRDDSGEWVYGAGFEVDYPFRYPDANEITRERVQIIELLRGAA